MFLTPSEIETLTGYEMPAWQRRWLDSHGWRYEKSASGRPVVLRAYANARMTGQQVVREPTMNLDAIRRRA